MFPFWGSLQGAGRADLRCKSNLNKIGCKTFFLKINFAVSFFCIKLRVYSSNIKAYS